MLKKMALSLMILNLTACNEDNDSIYAAHRL